MIAGIFEKVLGFSPPKDDLYDCCVYGNNWSCPYYYGGPYYGYAEDAIAVKEGDVHDHAEMTAPMPGETTSAIPASKEFAPEELGLEEKRIAPPTIESEDFASLGVSLDEKMIMPPKPCWRWIAYKDEIALAMSAKATPASTEP